MTISESAEKDKTRKDLMGGKDQNKQQTSPTMQLKKINQNILSKEAKLEWWQNK